MQGNSESLPPWKEEGIQFWSMLFIQAPRSKAFKYLTKGEYTKKYYLGMRISNPTRVGQKIWFGDSEESALITGTVKILDPPSKFSHTFRFCHNPDDPESVVEFELFEETPDLTCLVIRHYGYTDTQSATYNDICFGWSSILSQLKTLLETGQQMKFPTEETGV